MKSSTSQRAGSSRTFLKTMYFTSGAKVITRRLRTWTSPVRLYSLQSLRASSADTRRRLEVDVLFIGTDVLLEGGGTDGQGLYRVHTPGPPSPLWGNWAVRQRICPGQDLGDCLPQRLGHFLAERERCERAGQLRIAVHGHTRFVR